MEKIKIIGKYVTNFGELWDRSLESLFEDAVFGALNSVTGSKFNQKEIEAVFVANMAGGQFSNQSHLNALVSNMFDHNPPGFRVEAACASGGMALEMAQTALKSGKYKTVLVVGAEKMTDVMGGDSTKILSGASDYQKEYGSTFPALYALLAQAHMQKFGTTREQLSAVASKNHKHALKNQKAQFRKEIPKSVISKSTVIADPIRLLDCSPVSDGAAAVILTTKDIKEYAHKPVIEAVGHAQDSLSLAGRDSLTELSATKLAAKLVYDQLKIKPQDISFAEVHDCFTIAEIFACEDLGFVKKGNGGEAVELGKTTFGGEIVINPSGGLKACGHPVGATGIKQVAFLTELLEKKRSELNANLPIKHKNNKKIYALAHNVGGSGATSIVHIISTIIKK
jgi:acetyl-CoA C-acetyltransferase